MTPIGTIHELWRYPVKGMAGERLPSCSVGTRGIAGDRLWALWDVGRQEVQSCKFRPELLQCTAKLRTEPAHAKSRADIPDVPHTDVRFPDGTVMTSEDAAIHDKLSSLVGRPSRLTCLQSNHQFYRRFKADGHDWRSELADTFTRLPGEPLPDLENLPERAVNYVTIPGTFFLVSPLHVVTTSTMKHFKALRPEADWDIRRFRPNIVIETFDDSDGLTEQDWGGKTLLIGEAQLRCTETAPRCGAVTRPLEDLPKDASMLRTIVKHGDQNLGIYAEAQSDADDALEVGMTVYVA